MRVPIALVTVLWEASAFLLPQSPARKPAVSRSIFRSTSLNLQSSGAAGRVLVRAGKDEDKGAIRKTLAGMLMNPLYVDVSNFLCAEDQGKLIGFGQIRLIGTDYELASLHVDESRRKQGIGSILVKGLLQDFTTKHGPKELEHLFLLTLGDTVYFYEKLGFEVVVSEEAIPGAMQKEKAVGTFVQSFFGKSIVCMRAKSGTS